MATWVGIGTIFRSSGIARFVQGGVVKNFCCAAQSLTAQSPHIIENQHPTVDFGGMYLYRACRATRLDYGDNDCETIEYSLPLDRPPNQPTCSSLWSGYVDRYVLNADGTLDHVGYAFLAGFHDDNNDRYTLQDGIERVTGDFYLQFRADFFGPHTYVPFRDGKIVTDRNEWQVVGPPSF